MRKRESKECRKLKQERANHYEIKVFKCYIYYSKIYDGTVFTAKPKMKGAYRTYMV